MLPEEKVEPVILETIDAQLKKSQYKTLLVQEAQHISMLINGNISYAIFENCSDILAEEIAVLARRLWTENIPHTYTSTHLARRFVPLIKITLTESRLQVETANSKHMQDPLIKTGAKLYAIATKNLINDFKNKYVKDKVSK